MSRSARSWSWSWVVVLVGVLGIGQAPIDAGPPAAPAPPGKADKRKIFDLLKRNGLITYSEDGQADGARADPIDAKLASWDTVNKERRRKVFIRGGLLNDADFLRGRRIRVYDQRWGVVGDYEAKLYMRAIPRSTAEGGDADVDAELIKDYLGSFLRYVDLSKSEDDYKKAREDFFNFLKKHLVQRYATGMLPPLVMPEGSPALQPKDLFDETAQRARSLDFVRPNGAKIAAAGGAARLTNWTLEMLFQKRSSWPEIDGAVIRRAGSTTEKKRSKGGQSDFWGWWLSPAMYETNNPGEVTDEYDAFLASADGWTSLKESGLYDVFRLRNNETLDLREKNQYSVLWYPGIFDPREFEYYFDPGHGRDDLNSLEGGANAAYHQYQCQVLVKSEGDVDGVHWGPYYHSDLIYVEMYATLKTIPETLADARKLYGFTNTFAYEPKITGDGAREITPPDETHLMFTQSGTPDGIEAPMARYPAADLDFKENLPETFNEDVTVYFKTGADTQSLIRFPPKGMAVPDTLPPEARTPAGLRKFLDEYYPNCAVYHPAREVDGVTMGPWVANATRATGKGHPYAPGILVPGIDPPVKWKDYVYRPTRFGGDLEDVVNYLYTAPNNAKFGTGGFPGAGKYKYAMMGEVYEGKIVFEVKAKNPDYVLKKGSFPVPVGYQTIHGDVTASATQGVIAGADVQLADSGVAAPKPGDKSSILPARDNYAFSAVTISAGCCGTTVQKLLDKKVASAFQPRAGVAVTLTDSQAKTATGSQASVETLGLPNEATGKSSLPYDPMSISSRMPEDYKYGNHQNNFASLSYKDERAPGLFTDARGKNVLESQLTYYAGQAYDLRVSTDPATGPTVVGMRPDGTPTPPNDPFMYYCARELTVEVVRVGDRAVGDTAEEKVKSFNLLTPPLTTGPFTGLNTEPPTGAINMVWPKDGHYEVRVHFVDCNGQARDVATHVTVAPKGFTPEQIGEERQRKGE